MGASSSLSLSQQSPQLLFYTTVPTPKSHSIHSANSDIYTSTKLPNCYIIKIFMPFSSARLQLFQKIENQQNIYLLGLYGFKRGKDCQCSMHIQEIVADNAICFWQYLSFTLEDATTQKLNLKLRFTEIELWHIIKACANGYLTFGKLNIYYDFCPSRLMVNQQGRVRLDWMHVEYQNTHSLFYQRIHSEDNSWDTGQSPPGQQYLSPEEMQALKQKQFTTKINFQKSNIFSLGMTILSCMTLTNPLTNIYQGHSISYQKIEQTMRPLSQLYSQELLRLVGSMLNYQVNRRPGFEDVLIGYKGLMKSEYCISVVKPMYGRESEQVRKVRNDSKFTHRK